MTPVHSLPYRPASPLLLIVYRLSSVLGNVNTARIPRAPRVVREQARVVASPVGNGQNARCRRRRRRRRRYISSVSRLLFLRRKGLYTRVRVYLSLFSLRYNSVQTPRADDASLNITLTVYINTIFKEVISSFVFDLLNALFNYYRPTPRRDGRNGLYITFKRKRRTHFKHSPGPERAILFPAYEKEKEKNVLELKVPYR